MSVIIKEEIEQLMNVARSKVVAGRSDTGASFFVVRTASGYLFTSPGAGIGIMIPHEDILRVCAQIIHDVSE